MMKPLPPIPKRDILPSSRQDFFTKALDDTYERGFLLGRAAGLERACQLLRTAGIPNIGDLLEQLVKDKYTE
jgi:hypothetical protein